MGWATYLRGVLLATCLSATAALAAPGVMIRTEGMRSAPNATAPVVANLAQGTQVEIIGRQGGWTQVRASGRTGWVRLLSVRGGPASQTDVAGELKGVLAIGGQQRDPSRVVAVAGVRGLTEAELRNAQFSEAEVARMEGHGVTAAEAARFAAEAGLARQAVPYLAPPRAASQPASPWGSN